MKVGVPVDNDLLQRIADCVPAIVALYSPTTGRYFYINKTVTRILGYTPKEVMEGGLQFLAAAVHPHDLARIMDENQRAIARANKQASHGGDELIASFEYRMRHKDGEWRWLHTDGTVFKRDASGAVDLILNVSLDITAQKQTELQLSHSLKALESVLKV
jgi:PAS domain S-box-containing protein